MTEEELNELGHFKMPVLKVIREKCLDCCCSLREEVKHCPITSCPSWPYRMGRNPFNNRRLSDEQRKAAADRLRNIRK